jgi:hypothetical protein
LKGASSRCRSPRPGPEAARHLPTPCLTQPGVLPHTGTSSAPRPQSGSPSKTGSPR